jgi:hypothetical protein
MTDPELKPCPFCGGAYVAPSVLTGGIFCEECGADGPWSPAFHGGWNTRAAPPLSAALELPEVKALVAAAKSFASADTVSVHTGYDNGVGGGNYIFSDAVPVDSDEFRNLRTALAAIEKGATP